MDKHRVAESESSDKKMVSKKRLPGKKEQARETDSPLLGPGALALLTLVAGPLISGPAAASVFVRIGRKKTGWLTALGGVLVGLTASICLVLWPVKWYWSSLALLAVHIGCAAILFYVMRTLYVRLPELYQTDFSSKCKQEKQYLLVGMLGGTVMCFLLGTAATIFFLLGSDWMFATFMPVASSDEQTLAFFFVALFCLASSGCIAGGYMGKQGLKVTPIQMFLLASTLIWVSLNWLLALELIIAIPGFQAGQAAGAKRAAAWFPFITGNLLVGIWWTPFIFSYIIKPFTLRAKLLRIIQVPVIHLSAGISLAILIGYSNNIFHASGRYFERQAQMPAALWCYEQGLKRNPSAASASYLQYRVALLAHKLGDRERAQQGFRNVVSKYTFDDKLVKKSNRFLDNMSRNNAEQKRVVLPGIEAHIAYKGSYCVPNSLAQVMRFWGSSIDAREIGSRITGLSRGTMIVDQAWYAEQEGFQHDFLPNASIDDIKAAIDAGFPVMVYVPSHVFTIVGYDDVLDTFVTYDVATSDVWVDYLQKDFVKSWKRQGTTLVLAYPPESENLIPKDIKHRLVDMSEGYLHYHLHNTESPESYSSSTHLLQAAGKNEAFFIPLTVLYKDFPGLRPVLDERFSKDATANAIVDFFSSDFDEGIHLWGQYHDEDRSKADQVLEYGLNYLVGQRELTLAQDLIASIEEQGPISDKTKNTRGMIDMALGDFESGVHRLNEGGDSDYNFYLALADLQLDNSQAAIGNLVKTVDDCT